MYSAPRAKRRPECRPTRSACLLWDRHVNGCPQEDLDGFEHFTRPEALLLWMGEHAVLDPEPGGEFTVDIRGVPVRGRLRVRAAHRCAPWR